MKNLSGVLSVFIVGCIVFAGCGAYGVDSNQVALVPQQIFDDNPDADAAADCIKVDSYWAPKDELKIVVDMECMKPIVAEKVQKIEDEEDENE